MFSVEYHKLSLAELLSKLDFMIEMGLCYRQQLVKVSCNGSSSASYIY